MSRRRARTFHALDSQGRPLPLQTWPLAYWPDGTLKWTAHALPAGVDTGAAPSIRPGKGAAASGPQVSVTEQADAVEVDTGVIRCRLPRQGDRLIDHITRDGRTVMGACSLVAQADDRPDAEQGPVTQTALQSRITRLTIEQRGPVRAVVKVDGKHRSATGREWLPFSVRLYFYAGAESVRVMHTFVFDGDDQKDFLRGIGLRVDVPLRDALHDRHIRFAGEAGGLWAEGVRNLTGLRRDPGAAVREAQLAGRATPPLEQWGAQVRKLHHRIPAWGDYTLSQLSADGFQIKKRTQAGHGWIPAAFGRRAPGSGYIGGASGGVVFGLRDFWQRHPTQLDVRNAHTDAAQVTLWMHSPEAPAMDLRFYHDGLGQETHAQELEGLEMTYEDYEKGFGTPVGIARSSEITLWALAATPSRERLVQMAGAVQTPPQLAAAPQRYLQAGVFGKLWSLPDRSTPTRARIEDKLDFLFSFYAKEVGAAALVRLLGLRRRPPHLRRRPPRVALRRGWLRLGQLRTLARPVALVRLPAQRPGRHLPLRRGHGAPHQRGGHLSPRPIPGPGHAAQRAALGLQRQAGAHLHGGLPAHLLLPHRRRARGGRHARGARR